MTSARVLRPLSRCRRIGVLTPRCFSTPAPETAAPAASSNDTLRNGVIGVSAVVGALGLGAYFVPTSRPFELPEITDAIFDENDNLAVVVINAQPSESVQRRITELRDFLHATPALRHVRLYHTKQKPIGIEEAEGEEIKIMVYKGHRKEQKSFTELPKQFIEKFFVPRSEDPFPLRTERGPQNISRSQFEEMVIKPSFERPILVQAYEDTCFMCFLMRPFIESFARMEDSPYQFRRLNVDRNDFPDGFPVTRATPTFILFQDGKAEKWDEFKPNDIATKLDNLPVATTVKERIQELVPQVQVRFQMFTACVMMQLDLDKLQRTASNVASDEEDKDSFEEAVTQMMLSDMQRTDDMEENLAFLKAELTSIEEDVNVLADMLKVEVPALARLRKAEAGADVAEKAETETTAELSATETTEAEVFPTEALKAEASEEVPEEASGVESAETEATPATITVAEEKSPSSEPKTKAASCPEDVTIDNSPTSERVDQSSEHLDSTNAVAAAT